MLFDLPLNISLIPNYGRQLSILKFIYLCIKTYMYVLMDNFCWFGLDFGAGGGDSLFLFLYSAKLVFLLTDERLEADVQ